MLISFCETKDIRVANMEKKYELIPSDKEGFYRIKALKDFNDVKKGDIGGYIEGEKNLSHDGNCWIYDNAVVCDNAIIQDNAKVYGKAEVWYDAVIRDNAVIQDNVIIRGEARIIDNAIVRDNVIVHGKAVVCGDAIISSDKDYMVFKNWWSSGRYFTWTRSNNMWKVGCFYGTGEELIAKAYEDDEEKGREYERIVKYVEIVNNF